VRAAADRVAAGADPRAALGEVDEDLPASLRGMLELPVGDGLPAVLSSAAAVAADRAEERRRLSRAILWPLGVAGATLLVAGASLALLAPEFRSFVDDFGSETPWFTEVVLTLGEWLGALWFLALPLGILAIVLPMVLFGRSVGSIWPFSSALRPGEQARLCEQLAVLIDARVPLPEALRAVGWACPDARVGLDVARTADSIEHGADASSAAARRRYLPVQLRAALRRANDPDSFAEALRFAAATLRARLDARLGPAGMLAAAFQPLLMVGLGVVVFLLVYALLLPLISLLNYLS
ncbi:type II secretion system F family protein, partial [Alienimonas chondri]|uniref:type II secretion system F family protein n=1 Tax=Alienimonas chondri TaxID=2681879 RepID=UPI0014893393